MQRQVTVSPKTYSASHRITLIENHELVLRDGTGAIERGRREDLPRAGERLDLVAHNIDTAVIGRIQLQHHLPHVLLAIYAAREREHGRRLAGAWGPVEEEVRQPVGFDEAHDGREDVLVAGDVFEGVGAVFLNPGGDCWLCERKGGEGRTMGECLLLRRAGWQRFFCPSRRRLWSRIGCRQVRLVHRRPSHLRSRTFRRLGGWKLWVGDFTALMGTEM